MGRRRRQRVEELANGLLELGIGKGDPVAILGTTRLEWALLDFALGSIGAVDPRSTRTARRPTPRTSSTTRTPSRPSCEDEAQAREGRLEDARSVPRADARCCASTSWTACASAGASSRRTHPPALDDAAARRRRGGHLHLHLHLGHDRAAEGLHDPAPQLLRDGRSTTSASRTSSTAERRAPLPAARPQLRPPRAPARRRVGFTLALLSDPIAIPRAIPGRCGRRSSRASRASTRRSTRRAATFDEARDGGAG